eukprot:ctg_7140.g662
MLSASAAVRGAMDVDADLQRLLLVDGGLLRLRVKAVVGERLQVELMAPDPPPAALVEALTRLPYRVPLDGGVGGGGGDKLRGGAGVAIPLAAAPAQPPELLQHQRAAGGGAVAEDAGRRGHLPAVAARCQRVVRLVPGA